MNLQNAAQYPKTYYGLHSQSGVVAYPEKPGQPKIYFSDETLASMNPTFSGKPVVVKHVGAGMTPEAASEVNSGHVIKSFFNDADGKHWAMFIVTTDEAIECIEKKGWGLSNANSCRMGGPGKHSGLAFDHEAVAGEYEHLALVPNPRYDSMILDEANFALYCQEKKKQLTNLMNSLNNEKEEVQPMLNLFNRKPVEKERAVELENTTIMLPKSKRELTIVQLANELDEKIVEEQNSAAKPYMCNGEERVKVGDKEMSVNELLSSFAALSAPKVEGGAEAKNAPASPAPAAAAPEKAALPAETAQQVDLNPKLQNSAPAVVAPAPGKSEHFESMMNADSQGGNTVKDGVVQPIVASQNSAPEFKFRSERVAIGKSKYGSK